MHILQLLIALVDGYAYIILDMDQLLAKTLSPIAGIYLWTMELLRNLVQMVAHSLHWHHLKCSWRHGVSNIASLRWAIHNQMDELRQQLKQQNESYEKIHWKMVLSTMITLPKQSCSTAIHHYPMFLSAQPKFFSTESSMISLLVIPPITNYTRTRLYHKNNENILLLNKISSKLKGTILQPMLSNHYH